MKFVHVLPNIDYSNRGGVSKKKTQTTGILK